VISRGDISIEREDAVAILMLDRPDKHNAITQYMRDRLVGIFSELALDSQVRAVVLTGAGNVSFCAGTDVTEFKGRSGVEQWRRDVAPSRIFEVIERFPKPVVAMIDGYAFGGGCELALACDIRVSSSRSQFGQLEINFGLIPGGGGTQRLTRLCGRGQAMRLILSGDKIDAVEAHRIGLVDILTDTARLRSTTMALAGRIATHHPLALEMAKAAIMSAEELPLSAGLRYEASLMGLVMSASDQEQRIDAFSTAGQPRAPGSPVDGVK
jgi:enoyl-CoA hydratase